MTHTFASVIGPIILEVLNLIDDIHLSRYRDPETVHQILGKRFDQAERALSTRPEWPLARFALAAWIDEQLSMRVPWDHKLYWANNTLQFRFENRQDGREEFFRRADEAARLKDKDAIEVFFLCVVLDFKGVYQDTAGLATPADIDLPGGGRLPPKIEGWIRNTRGWIAARKSPQLDTRPMPGMHEAPPLEGRFRLLAMTLLFATMLATAVVLSFLLFPEILNR